MDGNRSARLLALLVIMAMAVVFVVVAFTEATRTAQPAGKPRRLTPAEQRDSLNPKKKIAEG